MAPLLLLACALEEELLCSGTPEEAADVEEGVERAEVSAAEDADAADGRC